MSEQKFELRPLKSTDLGVVCKIVAGIGLREFKACLKSDAVIEAMSARDSKKDDKDNIARNLGLEVVLDVAGIIMSNIPKVENDIQKFSASVAGLTLKEIQELDFADFGELIMQIIMKEDFKDFFGRVVKLLK